MTMTQKLFAEFIDQAGFPPGVFNMVHGTGAAIGDARVLTDHAQLRTYECDGLANFRVTPAVVVLAESTQHVADAVRLCAEAGVPFVARGSGTGLSGGALPVSDGVVIVLSRMRSLGPVDADNARVVVEPGVINLWVTRDAAPHDLAYAPDPSSQQVCSIGGNVAENAGGAHCLKYGFTVNHVLGAEVVLPDGSLVHLGGTAPEHPGYDLLGTFIGSEGTLGIATSLTLRLVRVPEAVQTMLVGFSSVEDAAGTVSDIIAAGIVPAAIEMMDALAIEAAEAAVHCGYPEGAVAVLVIELDGPQVEVEAQFAQVERIALSRKAFETRIAQDAAERALMWKGRKSAFAAVGRISPAYFVQDGVIPRTKLPEVLADRVQLTQIFQNLIGNALKFRREGVAQRVTVSAEPSDAALSDTALSDTALSDVAQMWHFTVRDNGIGIAAEYFERIFVIFQRLHTRESFSGSGIGLAICQRLIERHGGKGREAVGERVGQNKCSLPYHSPAGIVDVRHVAVALFGARADQRLHRDRESLALRLS